MSILPDCTLCGGAVELDLDDVDGPREVCTRCALTLRPVPPRVDRREVRAQARQVRRTRPLLCPSCLGRRCFDCHAVTCECPGHHARRPTLPPEPRGDR